MMQSQISLSQVCQRVECLVKDHNQKTYQNQIIEICMKQGCTQSNILCGVCKNLHKEHREYLVSIAEIEDAYIEFRNAKQDNENKKLVQLLNEFEQFATQQLEIMITNLRLLIDPVNILETILMNNKQPSYQQLKDHVSVLIKLIEFDNFQVKFKQIKQQEINNQINNQVNQFLVEITNFIQYHGIFNQCKSGSYNQWNELTQKQKHYQQNNAGSGVFFQAPQLNNLYFLQEYCGSGIEYKTPYCVKSISNDIQIRGCEQRAYLNRNLKQNEGASLVFLIKSLREINESIGIGICQYQKVLQQQGNGLGSGHYFVDSNGFTFNDNYKNVYSQNFKMVEDQKYRFTFDPANKENKQFILEQVEYSANKAVISMKIDYIYHYRIFFYLKCVGSEIELINM